MEEERRIRLFEVLTPTDLKQQDIDLAIELLEALACKHAHYGVAKKIDEALDALDEAMALFMGPHQE